MLCYFVAMSFPATKISAKRINNWLVFSCLFFCINGISQTNESQQNNAKVDSMIVLAAHFMDNKNYDTAQQLLLAAIPIADKQAYTSGSYFSRSYLAEVYYLNGLIDNALIILVSARKYAELSGRNDLKADVENLTGLMKDEAGFKEEAIIHFYKSLQLGDNFSRDSVFNFSHLYQVQGNLAQAYLFLHKLDSAQYFANLSYEAAAQLNSSRGKGIAAWVMGNVAMQQKNIPTATKWLETAMNVGYKSLDYELLSFTFPEYWQTLIIKSPSSATDTFQYFNRLLIEKEGQVGQLSLKSYYKKIASIFKEQNQLANSAAFMFSYDSLRTILDSTERTQRLKIFERLVESERNLIVASVANEQNEIELKNNRLLLIGLGVLFALLGLFVYLYFKFLSQRQHLKVLGLRQRLSSDLHDNIGSSLSSISLYSEVARQKIITQPEAVKNVLDKISDTTYDIMAEIKDTIWFMKPANQSFADVVTRIHNYAAPICMEKGISFAIENHYSKQFEKLSLFQRKNIYLVLKEAINNALKYANADTIVVNIAEKKGNGEIAISDNGIGLCKTNNSGNGLGNMKARAKEMNGNLEIISPSKGGLQILLQFPLTIIGE